MTHRRSPAVAATGVVYGDIGTSPLYTVRQAFVSGSPRGPLEAHVLGICSLIIWTLLIIVTVKYVTLVLRANRDGEGGVLSLFSLIDRRRLGPRLALLVGIIGVFGTALLFGDGMITPAISVLSAFEGFGVATTAVEPYVDYAALAVLVVLFAIQRRGTARIARLFAPVMILWFATMAVLGIRWIAESPSILRALLPTYGFHYLLTNSGSALVTLGAVFLAVTGAEALYADLGHFGRSAITRGWYRLVLPSLLLCYLGQSAAILQEPARVANPFFLMAPAAMVVPLAVLATAATVIASQALISGVFSLTTQAIHLGYAPRLRVVHTSRQEVGQVYVPFVNWTLLGLCVSLIVLFRTSERLADAYGVAVVSTMAITTVMLYIVARQRWQWSTLKAMSICAPLLGVDLVFMTANASKVPSGGWLPLLVAVIVYTMLSTWRRGQSLVREAILRDSASLDEVLGRIAEGHLPRTDGTAVYFHHEPDGAPRPLVDALERGDPIHRTLIFLTVLTTNDALTAEQNRFHLSEMRSLEWQVTLYLGFAEHPQVPSRLAVLEDLINLDLANAPYFIAEDVVVPASESRMGRLRLALFIRMSRAALDLKSYFDLPIDRVEVTPHQVAI